MDNAYGKGHNGRPDPASTVPIKIPKNLRQIGNIHSRGKIIYVEDYVMTFIKQLSERNPGGCKAAVLLGYYAKTENCKNIFIKGAIEMKNVDLSSGISLTDEGWTGIYENIKKYFTDVEIIGWALTGPEFYLDSMEKIKKVHMSNFSGPDKVFLKLDSMEKEESFYISENNQLVLLDGYYIYYEKNEEMQNYMVENKEEDTRVEASYEDNATKKIRSIIKDKKEVKDDRNVIRLLYAASSLLAIIVLVIAATMLDNYDKMKSMESVLNNISETLSLANDDSSNDDTRETMGHGAQNSSTDSEEDNGVQNEVNVDVDDANSNKDTENVDTDSNQDTEHVEAEGANTENGNTLDVETVPGDVTEEATDVEEATQGGQKEDLEKDEAKDNETAEEVTNVKPEEKETTEETPTRYYTVESGDSLAAISYKLYETYAYMNKIKELNGIEDENKIYAGQKIIVP